MIGFASQRLMELEVGALTGAGFGEKSAERLAQHNGYRKSQVSRLCEEIDERVHVFLEWPIEGPGMLQRPCLWIDATYMNRETITGMLETHAMNLPTVAA